MNIDQVVDFVCRTPENTNPNVLRSVLQDMSGGGATYTAGENIAISSDNVISATDEKVKSVQMTTGKNYPLLLSPKADQATASTVNRTGPEVYVTYRADKYSPIYQVGFLRSPYVSASYGVFEEIASDDGTAVNFTGGASFAYTPQIKTGVDPDTGEDIYDNAITESGVNNMLSTFSPNSFMYVMYKEIYPGDEVIETSYLNDRFGTVVYNMVEQGMTSDQIFQTVAQEGSVGEGAKIDFLLEVIDASEGEENITVMFASAPLTVSYLMDAEMVPIVGELNSADFYNPSTQTWQYAHITSSDEQIGDTGIPITVELFDSSTKYQS